MKQRWVCCRERTRWQDLHPAHFVTLLSVMSGRQSSAPIKGKQRRRVGGDGGVSGAESRGRPQFRDPEEVYKHAVTEEQAALLTNTGNNDQLEEVKKMSGVDLQFEHDQSPVPGMKIINIRGHRTQIEAAVKLINKKTGTKKIISEQAQEFWHQWVEAAFPDLDSRAYFLPPVYFNRVPMTRQSTAGRDVLALQSAPGRAGQPNYPARSPPCSAFEAGTPRFTHVQDSDVRDDAAVYRVLVCLQKMFERNRDVLIGLSQLEFGQYLGEPCYAAAAAQLPRHLTPSRNMQGDFDVLLIHRCYGFVICEVKCVGDNICDIKMSEHDMLQKIRNKLKESVSQLDKAEAMLSHLVSDIAPGLRITKTIAFPNLTVRQVQQSISGDIPLEEDLCRCLGTSDSAAITGVCLCCDQLSDPKTPCDVSSHVLRELGHWWQRRVAGAGPDSHMTPGVYKTLVARFCGPATTVSVPCTCPPRVSVKTLGQAVWCTGECYTAVITLFPEQVHLLHTAPPTLFVTGPPGTGKTVVLLLMAIQWLRCGHHVYIVSTWRGSRAVCTMLYHLLLKTLNTQLNIQVGKLSFLQYAFDDEKDVEKAVNDLSQAAVGGSLYVIADEVVTEYRSVPHFKSFCNELQNSIPRLYLWASSCYHKVAPDGWQVEYFTRPLRSPPTVVREVRLSKNINSDSVHQYTERGVPDHTDGPPVTRIYHGGQGHPSGWLGHCVTCGDEVARFLHGLHVHVPGNVTTPSTASSTISRSPVSPCLQWRDVLLLCWENISDNRAVVTRLREAGIPVRVMKDDDIEDVATARSDVVWVADGDRVRGLERKVVVCLGMNDMSVRLHVMSRCTSQLVIVSDISGFSLSEQKTV